MALDLCKYYKKQRYVSYNDGLTWQPLDEYERGELYEAHSSSCGAGVFQYRWVLINNGYICDGKDRYTREVYQYSEDGTVWYNVWPTIYRKGTLVESNSPFCDNAGNGQYESGSTEPITADTENCPDGYYWNGYVCVCSGHSVGDDCVVCRRDRIWNENTKLCECNLAISSPTGSMIDKYNQDCSYSSAIDPLKIIKCQEGKEILTNSDVNYFSNGWSVISYEVGDCITKIGDSAFNGQIIMSSITISSSVEKVGKKSFANCKSLTSINFPTTALTEIGESCFINCENMRTVTFGGSIPSVLPNSLFSNCINLQTNTWLQYNNITTIGEKVFYNCYSLNNVTLPESLQTIGEKAFYSNYAMENITIPSGVTSIGANAFENCSGMTFVNINSDEVSIGDNAFKGDTSLTAVTINSSGLTIGNNVFSGCTRLLKLTFTATVPPEIEEGDFDNTNECAIFVPCESEEAYKTAWSQYADRISCNDTGIYYRWIDDDGIYCDGYDQYTRQKQQSTTNGITWTDTGVYRPVTFITSLSRACGYEDEVALTVTNSDGFTRYYEPCDYTANTRTISDYYCENNNKYYGDLHQISYDSGETWYTTAVTNSTLVEEYSLDCGTMLFEANYSDGKRYRAFYDGVNSNLTSSIAKPSGYSYNKMQNAIITDVVTSIDEFAFEGCTFTSVTIGNSVTTIAQRAFRYCNRLVSITITAKTPPSIAYESFLDTNNCIVYVPAESLSAYMAAWDNGIRGSVSSSRIRAIPT